MKVCHILYSGLGGHGSVFFSLLGGTEPSTVEHQALFVGIETLRPEYVNQAKKFGISYFWVQKKRGLDVCFYQKVYKALKKLAPKIIVIHAHTAWPAVSFYTLLKNISVIAVEHQQNRLKNRLHWLYTWINYTFAKKIVVLTTQYKDELTKYIGLNKVNKKTVIISNGIDTFTFIPRSLPNQTTRLPLLIGMHSRFISTKDIATLIHSIKHIKGIKPEMSIKLELAGDGPEKDSYISLINSLSLQQSVELVGLLDKDELVPWLQNLDVYVLATLGEAQNTAVMQAMATGLPIVASNAPGVPEMIVDGENGLLVQMQSPELMGEAILKLLNSADERKRLGQNNRNAAVLKYNSKQMAESYISLYQEVVK